MTEAPPALVLAISATGLAVGRSLGRRGIPVYGAGQPGRDIGKFSKYLRKPSFGYNIDLESDFLEKLVSFSNQYPKRPVLFPSSDVFIEFVSDHFHVLNEHYILADCYRPETAGSYLDKKKFYALCDRCLVPYPKSFVLQGNEHTDQVLQILRLPLLLKPNLIHVWKDYLKGRKVIVIETKEMLQEIFRNEKSLLQNSILQEIIPGNDDTIYLFKGYFDRQGQLIASFTGRKIRQYPPLFGSASYAISCYVEEVERQSIDFLKKAGFKGLCGAEFKYDPRDENYKMIEVNIRPQTWEDLARVAGRDILWTAYCDLAGLPVDPQGPQKEGAVWCYTQRDILSGLWHVRNKTTSLSKWMKSYLRGVDTEALMDLNDLKLTAALPLYLLREALRYKCFH